MAAKTKEFLSKMGAIIIGELVRGRDI